MSGFAAGFSFSRLRGGLGEIELPNVRDYADDVNLCRLSSFSGDTLISTPDGEVPIRDIQIGDLVLAAQDGEVHAYHVTATHQQQHYSTLDLTIDGEVVHTTEEHPFLTSNGKWIEAGDLQVGNAVLRADGTYGMVESVVVIDELQTMYNLTVEVVATYLVGIGQWVVHNEDGLIPIGFSSQQWEDFQKKAREFIMTLQMPDGSQMPGALQVQGSRVPNAVDRLTGIPKLPRVDSDIDLGLMLNEEDFGILRKHYLSFVNMEQNTGLAKSVRKVLLGQDRLDKRLLGNPIANIAPNFGPNLYDNFATEFISRKIIAGVDFSIIEVGGRFDPREQPFASPAITCKF